MMILARKLPDPKLQGQTGQRLTLQVQAEKPNELAIILTRNSFRSYGGKQQGFGAVLKLAGGKKAHTTSLAPGNLRTSEGAPLTTWEQIDLLSFRGYQGNLGSKNRAGPQPVFKKLGLGTD